MEVLGGEEVGVDGGEKGGSLRVRLVGSLSRCSGSFGGDGKRRIRGFGDSRGRGRGRRAAGGGGGGLYEVQIEAVGPATAAKNRHCQCPSKVQN